MKTTTKKLLLNCFSRETLHNIRIDLHFLWVRMFNSISTDVSKLKPNARYLNVGCGPSGKEGDLWLNIDGWPDNNVDATLDLRRELPFGDERFKGVFAEHFFEHLDFEHAVVFLSECYRILAPGGHIRISVPDGQIYLDKYFTDRSWMLERRKWNRRLDTPMGVLNEVFRQEYEHKYCYDFETAELLLRKCGFQKVNRVDFGSGGDPELLIDRADRRFESLYIEGQKVQ